MLFERSLAGPIHTDCGCRWRSGFLPRPVKLPDAAMEGNNELLLCCPDQTLSLSPPPTDLHSQTVCFAFTYTYDLKKSFRSWISPHPPLTSGFVLVLSASAMRHDEPPFDSCNRGVFHPRVGSHSGIYLERGTCCSAALFRQKLSCLHLVYIIIIYFRGRDYASALVVVILLLNKCTRADVRPDSSGLLPRANVSSDCRAGNDQILWISVTFQSDFLASCKRFPVRPAPPSSYEQSGHICVCVRQGSTGDVSHQKMDGNVSARINTPNNFPSSLPHCNRCCGSVVFFLSHGAMWFHFLFIYALIAVLVLSRCGSGVYMNV